MACFSDDGLRDRDSWCGKAYEYNTVSYKQLISALNESYRQQAAMDTHNTATHT
jgi:hypothetical protein